MVDNTWDKITKRMTELNPWHTRMDKTKDLLYMEPYKLLNFQGQKMSNVINVTGNKAAVFANTVVADLIKGKWQMVVEGKLTGRQAHLIEQFIDDNLKQADEYLLERHGLTGLHEWLCNHVCVRGPIGAEWVSWIEDGQYKIHCLPLDMRWVGFQYGSSGFDWVAPITFRSRGDLEAEFPEYKGKFTGTTNIEVRDYWDSEKSELWVAKKLIETKPNPFGKPPFVIVFPPSGFMLRDIGYMEHEAEDIFFLMRGLNDENNRSLSIEQSLIFNVLKPGYEREVENMTSGPAQPVSKAGEVQNIPKGERAMPIPTGDLNRANLTAHQQIQRMIDEAAPIAPRLYTTPPSGAELLAEMEALARHQNSRIVALRVFREQLARLMIEQYIKIAGEDGTQSIGKRGRRRQYSVAQLRDPDSYSISCQLMTKSKRQELANLAMFVAAYGRLPLKYNLTNILMAEDPDGIIKELDIEQARKADPAIALYEMARRYAQAAADIEDEKEADALKIQSMMLTERGVAIIKQRQQPAQTQLPESAKVPEVKQPGGDGQGILPALLGGGGGRGGRTPQPVEEVV